MKDLERRSSLVDERERVLTERTRQLDLRAAELTERERKYKNTKTKLDLSDENANKL